MSHVTTVVIFGRYIPDKAQKMLEEGYVDADNRRVSFNHLSEYRPTTKINPWDLWAGGKGPESDVFGGAFNYLDSDGLKAWLETIPWYGKVAVVWASEDTEGFDSWTLGEGSDTER